MEKAATLIAPNMSFTSNLTFIPYIHSTSASEISVPEIDGKTRKMYRGGKVSPLITLSHCGPEMCPSLN